MTITEINHIKQNLSTIKDEKQYREYLIIIDKLVDCDDDSPEYELLELVSVLVGDYEDIHYPIEAPDPISAIKFRMEQKGLKQKDLVPYVGSKSSVSEVLNGKRELTIGMMRSLSSGLKIPIEVLVGK